MMHAFWTALSLRTKSRKRNRKFESKIERLEERVVLSNWTGNIPDGTVWLAGEVQVITGDVTVPAGAKLTIQPGAVIKMNAYYREFIVNGTILAQGTQANPITFTELRDDVGGDTNGDGANSSPANGNWGVLQFNATSTGSILDHVTLRYGGHDGNGDIFVNGGQLMMTNSTLANSNSAGIRIQSGNPTLTNIIYQNNSDAAVRMDLASNPAISGVTVTNNGINGLRLNTGTLVGDGFWDDPDIVYWLDDDVTVPVGSTLTIGAGQVIKRPYYADLFVAGTLNATGTTAAPVIFTERRDDTAGGDTNNDQGNSGPSSDNGGVIDLKPTSTANVMDHVEVRYAGHQDESVLVESAPLVFSNGVISDSSRAGIRIQSSNPTITGSRFLRNAGGAISMDLASNPVISGNTVTNNGVNGLVLDTGIASTNLTWNNPDIVYWMNDDITIPAGLTLNIAPGQVIKRPYYADLSVEGTLSALGTTAAPIIFTERRDDTAGGDTNNDQGNSGPSRDNGGVIDLKPTSTANVMDHVEVRYAGHQDEAVLVDSAPLVFTNGVIRDSSRVGLRIQSSNPTVTGSVFSNNSGVAISMDLASNPTFSGNTVTGNQLNAVVLDTGTLAVNMVWNDPDIVYVMSNDITVPVGLTLSIAAGQVIKRPYYSDLIVNGSLNATGTTNSPVIFTEMRDDTAGGDTNNDQATSTPFKDQSGTILFTNTSTANVMDHVEVRYGSNGSSAAVIVDRAPLTFTNGAIIASSHAGLRIQSTNAIVIGNAFTNNSGAAISMDLGANPTISGNTLSGSGVNGVVLDGGLLAVNSQWTNPDIVYWFADDITVPLGLTLTIGAGQVIKRPYFADLTVKGTLTAVGTLAAPIIFTETRDDTAGGDSNNDQSASSPFKDQSGTILFTNSSTANVMDHVEIRYGSNGASAAVIDDGAPLAFTNGAIIASSHAGLRIQSSNSIVTGNAFTNNTSGAISMDVNSNPTFTGNTLSGNGVNAVVVDGGTLTVNAQWTNPDIVYSFADDITVPTGLTLTVGAGQVIKRPYYADLIVNGTLTAIGTEAAPIIFTEMRDDTVGGDTNNDQSASAPFKDQSGVIRFSNTSTANVMDHVEVRYGSNGATAAVIVDGAPLTFTNGAIRESSHQGLRIQSSNAIVTGNEFTNNSSNAISMDLNSNPTFSGNTFSENGVNGVVLDGGTLTANGFWDDPDIVYWLNDDITVPAGVTLTIEPGQIIKRQYPVDLFVNGTLNAVGAVSAPIIFTETRDDSVGGDTNNDQANSHPGPATGGIIQFSASSTGSVLDHAEIRYAGYSVPAAVLVDGGDLTATDVIIRDTSSDGILVRNRGTVSLNNSLLVHNGNIAVRAESGAVITATNDTIEGNTRGVSADGVRSSIILTNSLVTNHSDYGINQSNRGLVTLQNNDVFNPGRPQGGYNGLPVATGQNGNIAIDPKYVDRANRDYHLQSTSPVIDAGTSTNAPIDDLDFNLRTDDLDVLNTGAGTSPFFDIGAYEFGGKPRALTSSPTGDVSNIVSQVVFTFRGAMDTSSFLPSADVVSFIGPSGPIAVTGFQWLNKYQLAANFATQSAVGDYQLVIGPNILNAAGQALDTDGDGTPAEPVDDRYAATWTIIPPRIIAQSPQDYTAPPVDHLDFRFDRPMDPASFALSDIVSFTGPTGNLTATDFTWVDARTLRISFPSQTALGAYHMVLGPNIADIGGNPLDQNGDGVPGQAPADNEIADFTVANIFHVSGDINQNTTWGGLVIVDDNVQVDGGVTLTINPGTIIKFQEGIGITVQAGATLNASGTTGQQIIFTSLHDDTIGGDSDHNGDKIGPVAGDWSQILNQGNSTFDHVQVLYGSGIGNTGLNSGAIRNSGGTVTFNNSRIIQAFYDGLDSVGGSITVSNSVFAGADRAIVSTFGGTTITIINSTFDDNRIAVFAHAGGSLSVTNSIIANSLSIGVDTDSGPQSVTNSDVYSTVPNSQNYVGMNSQTGTNGNISADPKFINAETGNYRLNFGSPAIDAANGTAAPATDQIGSPRYDDPRTANKGTITANNAYADMGAFEFIEGAASNLDLIVTTANVPASAIEGDTITVNWTTKNIGTAVATGAWHDAIYLSTDPILSPDDVLLDDVLHTGNLGSNQAYSGTADLTIPGLLPGNYYVLVRANSDNAVFEGANLTNNVTAATSTISLDVPALAVGGSVTGQIKISGDSQVFKIVIPAGNDVQISLNGPDGAANELYAMSGDIPSRQTFDARGIVSNQADQSVTLSGSTSGTYYLVVYGANVPTVETFTLTAATSAYHIDLVTPATGGNIGQVTITFTGANFDSTSHPQLLDAANHVIQPTRTDFVDSSTLIATFDLTGHATGTATPQVVTNNVTVTLPNGFSIVAGKGGNLVMNLAAPSAVRVGRDFTFVVDYSNDGDTDLLAPIIEVSTSGIDQIGLLADDSDLTTDLFIIAVSDSGPAGILAPGAHGQVVLHGKSTSGGNDTIELDQVEYPDTPIDWDSLEPTIRPSGLTDAEWDPLFAQLKAQIGTQWSDYIASVSRDATLLPRSMGLNYSLADVFELESDRAVAALNSSVSGHIFLDHATLPLSDAELKLSDDAHGVSFAVNSLTDGSFLFPNVPAGTYQLEVNGFIQDTPIIVNVVSGTVSAGNVIVSRGASISGNVVIAPSGAPLADQTVTARSQLGDAFTAHTDANGAYEFDGLPAGSYTLATGGGTVSTTQAVISVGNQQQIQHFNLSVVEGGSIIGKITGPIGQPVSQASVSVYLAGVISGAVVTADDGTFEIDGLAPGDYTLTALGSGFGLGTLNHVSVQANAVTSNVNLSLVTGGGVGGTITSSVTGNPVLDALITIVGTGTNASGAQPDNSGIYEIDNLAPGTYTVTVHSSGYTTFTTDITIVAGQTKSLPVALNPSGVLQGTVLDASHQPLANIQITAIGPGGGSTVVTTGVDGTYEIDGLDYGTYTLTLGSDPNNPIESEQRTVSAAATQAIANFALAAAGTISGSVFGTDGVTPLAGVEVLLFQDNQLVLDTITNVDGNYSFLLLKTGSYQAIAIAGAAAFSASSTLNVTAGTALADVDFTAGQISANGTFTDSSTLQAIAGATVLVSRLLPGGLFNAVAQVTTLTDGSFAIDRLVPGTYFISVSDGVHATVSSTFTVTGGGTSPSLNLSAGQGHTLSGTFTSASTGQPVTSVQVLVYRDSDHVLMASSSPDGQGQYQALGLADGVYDVVFSTSAGLEQQIHTGITISGGTLTLNGTLTASTTSMSGVLVSNGHPVAGVQVTATDSTGMISQSVTTDSNGAYVLDTLPAGSYDLTAQTPGQSTPATTVDLAVGQHVSNLTLTATPAAISLAAAGSGTSNVVTAHASPSGPVQHGVFKFPQPAVDLTLLRQPLPTPRPGCEDDYDNALDFRYDLASAVTNLGEAEAQLEPEALGFLVSSLETKLNSLVVLGDLASLGLALNNAINFCQNLLTQEKVLKEFADLTGNSQALMRKLITTLGGVEVRDPITGIVTNDNIIGNILNVLQSVAASVNTYRTTGGKVLDQLKSGQSPAGEDTAALFSAGTTILAFLSAAPLVVGSIAAAGFALPAAFFVMTAIFTPFTLYNDTKTLVNDADDNLNGYNDRQKAYELAYAAAQDAQARYLKALAQLKACNVAHKDKSGPARPPKHNPGHQHHRPVKKPVKNPQGGDPNDKIGPAGFGALGFIQSEAMPYEIEFENSVAGGATAPAQIVTITDTLDADIDASSLELTSFSFGSHLVSIPEGLQHYSTTVDLRPNGIDLLVPVELNFDPQTRLLTAMFQSIDPVTGLPPEDPYAGFLPINDATNKGVGFITYTVKPKSDLPTGTAITNQASIVFDTNAAILTPTTVNTLDIGGPTSHVTALPGTATSQNFMVNWSGTDDAGGSGIATFDVYVSDNGGDFTLWQSATSATSAVYSGQISHTYAFYSVATDNVGHIEDVPLTADATTFVPSNSPPVINDQAFNVAENSVLNAVIGTVAATDPDAGDVLTYSITAGNLLGAFAINSQTGSITVANSSLLDFETHPIWPLIVQVSDNHSATDTATVTINLTNVNEAPALGNSTLTIAENSSNNTIVGTVQGTDPDVGNTLTYSITGGNSLGGFAINSQTGAITVANSTQLDFETHPTFSLTVQVADNHGGTSTGTVTINLTDVNDPPQLNLNGGAVTFSAKAAKMAGATHVLPNVTVVDADQSAAFKLGGGTLVVSIEVSAKVSKKGKVTMNDTVGGLANTSSIGTAATPAFNSGKLVVTVHLNAGTTAAAIQAYLRGITFSSKATGLKLNHRTLLAQLTDVSGAATSLQQTVNVTK